RAAWQYREPALDRQRGASRKPSCLSLQSGLLQSSCTFSVQLKKSIPIGVRNAGNPFRGINLPLYLTCRCLASFMFALHHGIEIVMGKVAHGSSKDATVVFTSR